MSKLKHSYPGYRRLMQMSRSQAWVFVEGPTDRFVYSAIVDLECHSTELHYEVVTAEELPHGTGGKAAVLSFYDYLRRTGSLIDHFKGKNTLSVFFVDKDVDDFTRGKRRSKHIIYTEPYELENYFFVYGDMPQASAAAAALDIQCLRPRFADNDSWRRRAAGKWEKWITLCLFSCIYNVRSSSNFGKPVSPINDGPYGETISTKYTGHLDELRINCGLTSGEFTKHFSGVIERVKRLYSHGKHDVVFKGKWYAKFLAEDIRSASRGRRIRDRRLEERLLSHLAQTLHWDDAWTEYFRKPFRRLLSDAGLKQV